MRRELERNQECHTDGLAPSGGKTSKMEKNHPPSCNILSQWEEDVSVNMTVLRTLVSS